MRNRRNAMMLAAMLMASAWHLALAQERPTTRPQNPLAFALTAYAGGDHDVIKRVFARSLDFQHAHLLNTDRVERTMGGWQRSNAAFLIELAEHSANVAPAYSMSLLTIGRRYLERRPASTSAPADDTFERLWHQTAVGILQRRFLLSSVEDYIVAVEKSRAAANRELRGRLQYARAVLQEQRCWLERPVLMRVGTPVAELHRVSGGRAAGPPRRRPGELSPDVSRRLDCLDQAAEQFTAAAAASADAAAEAQIRLAWVQFQLGMFNEALATLDRTDPGTDPTLRYWATLFRARTAGALKRPTEAERLYRAALHIYPDAQSAGVGLALTLFELDRIDEANEASKSVRAAQERAPDPWWTYLAADSRFVDAWIRQLRALQ